MLIDVTSFYCSAILKVYLLLASHLRRFISAPSAIKEVVLILGCIFKYRFLFLNKG